MALVLVGADAPGANRDGVLLWDCIQIHGEVDCEGEGGAAEHVRVVAIEGLKVDDVDGVGAMPPSRASRHDFETLRLQNGSDYAPNGSVDVGRVHGRPFMLRMTDHDREVSAITRRSVSRRTGRPRGASPMIADGAQLQHPYWRPRPADEEIGAVLLGRRDLGNVTQAVRPVGQHQG